MLLLKSNTRKPSFFQYDVKFFCVLTFCFGFCFRGDSVYRATDKVYGWFVQTQLFFKSYKSLY